MTDLETGDGQENQGPPTRQDAINWLRTQAGQREASLNHQLENLRKGNAVSFAVVDNPERIRDKVQQYRGLANGIEQGLPQSVESARGVIAEEQERLHGELGDIVTQKEKVNEQLQKIDDTAFLLEQKKLSRLRQESKQAAAQGNYVSIADLADQMRIQNSKLWQTPGGVLREKVNSLGRQEVELRKDYNGATRAFNGLNKS